MNIVFRADASIEIGSGHVMRCLTLAEALRQQGHQCHFICRAHLGHLGAVIEGKGFPLSLLPIAASPFSVDPKIEHNAHANWLGASWQQDAEQCSATLIQLFEGEKPDWLVVDHYALDYRWQQTCKPYYQKLMVIDDLADRKHLCQLLLDQTYGRNPVDYQTYVPSDCKLLIGAEYAVLRPEFTQWRNYSLQRRQQQYQQAQPIQQLLINLGGVDKDNITGQVLKALENSTLDQACKITVVMGKTAPHLLQVQQFAASSKYSITVLSAVSNMAELMANADFAIGAAGSTAWERCTLGLPTLMIILADNQKLIAAQLQAAQAAWSIEAQDCHQLTHFWSSIDGQVLINTSLSAQTVADGLGVDKIVEEIDPSILKS
ncbi:UDP-2,4-diacetamido-2,4,6-trideoxy-beta-L-altropyranose hydrolase [Oceanospirillum multiglobuliferum]|uniref:UDP-2,4-diacetamido-2,4, 6-trideoxy-beta-L-altropyranose hydrolase n=1 Tax=Oceanospirillum multiglobuliferum TaxID=64969 RepID=A0A1T4RIQ7_9GAMM|nr:UDP-2,4-diacetamido-2,4,6-trideoxy-beta-L-altropyranose hydrolase [Oceanospirillum multiglobuliferum]OPX54809.1 UDP-2,4-diacetamido-2,4,6-trideoxy-beta-L-altropyranose hydrolase [Oceanospirillum multiglobuliferum]SKA15872.1 UDP-2,4-diacetamido-2,4,6-trideoxy-beta-L-altropyranose hydrolase [Oceanospirillum multiglobuliferum]